MAKQLSENNRGDMNSRGQKMMAFRLEARDRRLLDYLCECYGVNASTLIRAALHVMSNNPPSAWDVQRFTRDTGSSKALREYHSKKLD